MNRTRIIHQLTDYGILARHNNEVFFSSGEVRKIVGNMLNFSDEDYNDLYENENCSQETKAMCVLNLLKKKKVHMIS